MIGTWGGVAFPLNAADYVDTFAAADPARETLLALCAAAINFELAAVWPGVTATLPTGHALRSTSPVQSTLPLPPSTAVLEQLKAGFPLLALHRVENRSYSPLGANSRQRTQPWHLHYILGPLDVASSRKLLDVCLLVEAIVDGCLANGRHEAYLGGAQQFGPGTPFGRISITQAQGPGQALYGGDENSGAIYWADVITIETTETGSADTSGDEASSDAPLDGAAYDVGVSSDEGTFPSVVLADTDPVLE